ncbi:uncharacterized protein KY384_004454 [Bacidia gigantensis]|uniref:uncharacterized protein n=1 Tax=Bacidia gigantensis TaxID=2732470 RepID=UPI001D055835|nr:uncharacterized protein KY384_004454 [Bacidia gigantensis]KAG8531097.1 hypothetical protein KY384_004454 [Bacidia gigantensis]
MVNDLKPAQRHIGESQPSERQDDFGDTSLLSKPLMLSRVRYMSLQRTRQIIEESLEQFLISEIPERKKKAVYRNDSHKDIEPQSTTQLLSSSRAVDIADDNVDLIGSDRGKNASSSIGHSYSDQKRLDESTTSQCQDKSKRVFRILERYITACFSSECLNNSFLFSRPNQSLRAASESVITKTPETASPDTVDSAADLYPEIDAKTLLVGDFAENGTWWAGRSPPAESIRPQTAKGSIDSYSDKANAKGPSINWSEVYEWYNLINSLQSSWRLKLHSFKANKVVNEHSPIASDAQIQVMDERIAESSSHVQRTLFKASEALLRRPGRPLKHAIESRFLLILLANPNLSMKEANLSIQSFPSTTRDASNRGMSESTVVTSTAVMPFSSKLLPPTGSSSNLSRHSGIIKRILGIMSNLPPDCHHYLISWFSRFTQQHLRKVVELVGSFVTYRLSRVSGRKRTNSHDPTVGGLIPSISGPGAGTSAQLHAAIGVSQGAKSQENNTGGTTYSDDWQIKAAAKVMSLLFAASNNDPIRWREGHQKTSQPLGRPRAISITQKRAHRNGQLLPTSAFYNTMLDYTDLIADFDTWESRRGKLSFCQYPMFFSIWAKIHILEHDARRQMEIKAREAFFNSIMSRKAISQYLILKVRRDCLVEDSLRGVSEVVGTGQEEIKKGLRIEFIGEEGLDSGGLRKEWFLLLIREIFDQEHGLFVYDEDSQNCYFNSQTFETSDQFFLVGALLGLAIYNSTILDVALPPFAFRKLLASAPTYTGPSTFSSRPIHASSLDDLAEFRPVLAQGLRKLLEYDGDVESTFLRDFVAATERYGQIQYVPLCHNGEHRPVTNSNRREYVDLYVRYLLDTSVSRQYDPFKRGFFTVCGGNALSLFRPEEIELLIRGSDEPLDVATIRAVAIYDGWGVGVEPADQIPVKWFWEEFEGAQPKDQRKLLSFITASDRIPAMGATSLVIKIVCLGDYTKRYPIARTCFNMIGLYRYRSKEAFGSMLWRAVYEGEGFGMK